MKTPLRRGSEPGQWSQELSEHMGGMAFQEKLLKVTKGEVGPASPAGPDDDIILLNFKLRINPARLSRPAPFHGAYVDGMSTSPRRVVEEISDARPGHLW